MKNAAAADVQFLADLTKAAIDSARVYPDQETVGVHEGRPIPIKNRLGFTAIRPAGLTAYLHWKDMADAAIFREKIEGRTLLDRITAAYTGPAADPQTGVVFITAERRAAGFLFCDSIYMTGHLLTPSLEPYGVLFAR